MNTVVQLCQGRDDGPRAELVYGTPRVTVPGKIGPIAVFSSGALVAYRIGRRRRTRLFVFRTLDVDDRLAASLPGVHPRVHLLFEIRSAARARMVRHLFHYLAKSGCDPRSLPDGFYLRVGVVLGGRLPAHKVLLSLLANSLGPDPPQTRRGAAHG
ncbi:MAG: hypothetical protein ABSC94_32080 [Polyangiaceae bacterium]